MKLKLKVKNILIVFNILIWIAYISTQIGCSLDEILYDYQNNIMNNNSYEMYKKTIIIFDLNIVLFELWLLQCQAFLLSFAIILGQN